MGAISLCYAVFQIVGSGTHWVEDTFEVFQNDPQFAFPSECASHFGDITYQDGVRGVAPTIEWLGTEKQFVNCNQALLGHAKVEYQAGELRDLRIILIEEEEGIATSLEDLNLPPHCSEHYTDTTRIHERDFALVLTWTGSNDDWDMCFQGAEPWHDWLAKPAFEYRGVKMYDFYIRPVLH